MAKNLFKLFVCLIVISFVTGCAMKTYTQVKDREDQDMTKGNAGFISGKPRPEDRSNIRKTRKTYVLEILSPESAKQEAEIEGMIEETRQTISEIREDLESTQRELPARRVSKRSSATETSVQKMESFEEYTVKKNDTLQKISLKYYNTNHKWPKIFEANKDIIKDPSKISPGMVLKIPLE